MYLYTYAVPAAALIRLWDGHTYADVPCRIGRAGPTEPGGMVRADDAQIVDGVALVPIGTMGDAIAVLDGLPAGVAATHRA